ncbi:hypothetical protein ACFW81_23710 [Streptomyces angustmyceticus]|uniref:hypothetical protein n=1 Tax=Streptomyces angustmyceticus TaxID=285578 RepID=UPI00369F0634
MTAATTSSLTLGLRLLADDIDAGDNAAIDLTNDAFIGDEDIADYPTNPERRARIAFLGQPGPGVVPDNYEPPTGYRIPAQHLTPKAPTT